MPTPGPSSPPSRSTAPPPNAAQSAPRVVPDAAVLLVDDRPANLVALEATLAPLGLKIVTATSGPEALRHLLSQEFATILLDVQMPGMDGFETAALIKQHPRTAHVPIIFVTAIHGCRNFTATGRPSCTRSPL